MNARIDYLDRIKGFAIFLVVMGHAIAWQFNDFYVAYEDPIYDNQFILWRLIYSFHMPLFMFCSGLFVKMSFELSTCIDLLKQIGKKSRTLMLPYISMGLLLYVIWNRSDFYWFLLILFEFQVVNLSISYIASRCRQHSSLIEISLYLIIYILFTLLGKYGEQFERLPFFDIGHLGLYVYFTLGTLCRKFNYLEKITRSNNLYTLCLILLSFLWWLKFSYDINIASFPLGRFFKIIEPLSAIIVLFYFFRNSSLSKYMNTFLQNMGRHSLELYTLHLLMPLTIPVLGECYLKEIEVMGGGVSPIGVPTLCYPNSFNYSNRSLLRGNYLY